MLLNLALFAQPAQRVAPVAAKASNRLTEIRVTGSHRFQPEQLSKATGLALGTELEEPGMKAAADRLAATGMFSDVAYTYNVAPQGTRLEFKVNDVEKLLPVHFDNFVWLSATELRRQLEEIEPLFTGEVPNAGEMFQRIATDTKTILAKLNVAADVSAYPQAPQTGGDVTGFLYKVEGVKIPIRTVEFTGASPEVGAILLKKAQTILLNNDYSENTVGSVARLDFLPEYRMRGYLKAEFGSPEATLHGESGAVAVRVPVTEGAMYSVSSLQWSGNTVFQANELVKQLKQKQGQAANQVQLEEDLGGISKNYGTRGYMEARLVPRFNFDDAAHTVLVEIDVHEGDLYRMGKLRFEGLAQNAADSLRKLWTLKEGEPYDASYPGLFLSGASRQYNLSGLRVQFVTQPRRETKTVDLILRFEPK